MRSVNVLCKCLNVKRAHHLAIYPFRIHMDAQVVFVMKEYDAFISLQYILATIQSKRGLIFSKSSNVGRNIKARPQQHMHKAQSLYHIKHGYFNHYNPQNMLLTAVAEMLTCRIRSETRDDGVVIETGCCV